MSEDFVDVTWRGLEVVKKAKLRGTGPHRAYLEHGTPMPTGSQLVIRTADGHELGAIVAKVQEQIGGRSEPPGMEVTIEATGAAATWWLARAEAALAAPARATTTMPSMPDLVPPPMPEQAMAPMETGPTRPSPRAIAVTAPMGIPIAAPPPVEPPVAPPVAEPAPADDGRKTEVMLSVAAIEAAEAAAADNGDAIPQGIDDSVDRPGDPIVDDGRRTMIMPAVDIAAIVEASSRDGEGDDDGGGNGATSGAPAGEKKKARGKRRGRGR